MSYGQPQYGGYYEAQPPPDPFRAWYAARLAELTFNSRQIIQHLSLEAMKMRDQNNWTAMQAVVEEIEQAVFRAPPQGKLPLLYLIDSISKNIGPPYTDKLLPAVLPRLYLRAYREVDGVTKSKMEEMLKLWRNSGPYGGELYPTEVRESIERQIFGSMPPPMTQASVQATLREFLREKEEEMAQEFTPARGKRVNVLVQIDKLLSSGVVSPQELAEISGKIRDMKAGVEPSSANLKRAPPPQPQFPPQQTFPAQRAAYPPPNAYPPQPDAYPLQPSYPPPQPAYPGYPAAGGYPGAPAAVPTPPPQSVPAPMAIPAIPLNVADILKNLNNSGLLSQPRTPEPSAAAQLKSGLESYEDMILALDVRVDHFDLSRLSLPVSQLPVRCKQCGMRFPEGEDGKLQAHMDWHFRRNKKERETGGRGAHRRWLPRADEWINENAEAGPSNASPSKQAAPSAADSAKLSAERLASFARKWVRAPSDPAKAAIPCPICKEQFKSEWSEDEEEWVFMNAIDVHGTIYHATCRAEQMTAARTARLLNAGTDSARGGSPSRPDSEAPDAPSPGTKRKADEVSSVEGEDDAKRVKVEAGAETEVPAEPVVMAAAASSDVKPTIEQLLAMVAPAVSTPTPAPPPEAPTETAEAAEIAPLAAGEDTAAMAVEPTVEAAAEPSLEAPAATEEAAAPVSA